MSNATVTGPGITPGRYVYAANGNILDTLGGYYISRDLWDRRLADGRSDTARHDFRHLDVPAESIGQGYYLESVECTRCGEKRQVGITASQLNYQERWCVSPPSLWSRLFRRAEVPA